MKTLLHTPATLTESSFPVCSHHGSLLPACKIQIFNHARLLLFSCQISQKFKILHFSSQHASHKTCFSKHAEPPSSMHVCESDYASYPHSATRHFGFLTIYQYFKSLLQETFWVFAFFMILKIDLKVPTWHALAEHNSKNMQPTSLVNLVEKNKDHEVHPVHVWHSGCLWPSVFTLQSQNDMCLIEKYMSSLFFLLLDLRQ